MTLDTILCFIYITFKVKIFDEVMLYLYNLLLFLEHSINTWKPGKIC